MAFAYSDTTVTLGDPAVFEVSASDVGASDLIVVDVHSVTGNIKRWEVILTGGSGTTVDPTAYWDVAGTAGFQVVDWTGTAVAVVQSEVDQSYRTPTRRLYVKAAPDAGSDNTVLVRFFVGKRL